MPWSPCSPCWSLRCPAVADRLGSATHGPASVAKPAKPARGRRLSRLLDPADASSGKIKIGYEVHRARSAWRAILAIEGGPGYPSTGSRDYYLELFRPFLKDHDLLLIDARGTGTSGAINCRRLQSYRGSYAKAVRKCGKQLGATSDVYGSAFAADDFVAVLDKLGYDQVDVYGDSYGTFLGQTFAIRHPDRVRSLTLDAAYPVVDQNPWYPDLNRALRKCLPAGLRSVTRSVRAIPSAGFASG